MNTARNLFSQRHRWTMAIFIGATLVEARSGFHSIIKEDESCNVSKNNVVTYLSQCCCTV